MFYKSTRGNVTVTILIRLCRFPLGFVTSLYKSTQLLTAVANKKVAFKSTSSSSVGTQTSDFTSTKKQPVKREFLYFTDEETPKEKM